VRIRSAGICATDLEVLEGRLDRALEDARTGRTAKAVLHP
jgi:D-arabinose 1-dehydrogenase-like Zn-dependent alcohol dehydrogenase